MWYEYKVEIKHIPVNPDDFQAWLNEHAKDRWRLIQIHPADISGGERVIGRVCSVVFEREK